MSNTSDRELVMNRIFNAPRELVFKVWTQPEHVVRWWGPEGFTITIRQMDVSPGGIWDFTMHGPGGIDYPNRIEFIEVIYPDFLSWKQGSGDDSAPGQFEASVRFEEFDGKTELTMHVVFRSKEERDLVVEKYGAIEGNRQAMNKLEAYLNDYIAGADPSE